MLKKKAALILSGMLLLASLGGCGSQTDDTELADNQRYAYAVVTAIEGNEITYMEVDESQVISTEEDEDAAADSTESKDAEKQEQTDSDSDSTSDGAPSGDMPSGGEAPSGDMPSDGEAPSGDMPSGGEAPSGDMPSGGEAPSGDMSSDGEAPSAPSDMASGGEAVDMDSTEMPSDSGEKDTSNMTGSVVSTQIPVGVVVHTAADTETTFSRIATGDILKLLIETDDDGNEVILEIWMIEQ